MTGARPLGWYTGRSSEHSIRLVAEEGGFLYSADSYADDLPYWWHEGDLTQLVVPYTLDANDMRFATPQGFNSGDQFYAYLKDTFDVLYAEGESAPKMLSVGLHARLAGRPGRTAALARFLDYVRGARARLGRAADRHRAALDAPAPAGGPDAEPDEPGGLRRTVRRRLRALALDRGASACGRADDGAGHGGGPARRAPRGSRRGGPGAQARPRQRAPRSRRAPEAEGPHGGFAGRAGRRRSRRAGRRRARAASWR